MNFAKLTTKVLTVCPIPAKHFVTVKGLSAKQNIICSNYLRRLIFAVYEQLSR